MCSVSLYPSSARRVRTASAATLHVRPLAPRRRQLFAQRHRPLAHDPKTLGLERERLQLADRALDLTVAALVIGRGRLAEGRLQLRNPGEQPGPLLGERTALLRLGLDPAELRGRVGEILLHLEPLPVELVELGGLVLELIDPLLVEVAVAHHLLDLAIEQAEHVLVLRAERAGAGGAIPLGPGLEQALTLLPQVLVLVGESLPLGARVLGVAHPGRADVLRLQRDRGERGAEIVGPKPRALDNLIGGETRDVLVHRGQVIPHVRELRAHTLAPDVRLGEPLERLALGSESGQHLEPAAHLGQPLAGALGLGDLRLQPLDPLRRGAQLVIGHAELRLEREVGVAKLPQPLGARPGLGELPLQLAPRGVRRSLRRRRRCHALAGLGLRGVELGGIAEARPQRVEPGAQGRALLAEPVLRGADAIVPQHPREELGPLRRAHRRHHRQLLLAGEVGIEELFPGHAEEAGDPVGDRAEAVRDGSGLAVLVELRAVERADDAVVMRAEREIHLHLDPLPRPGPAAANGVAAAARGRHPVHRPRDGLEDGGLPRPVRTDDAGQARPQLQLGVLVLAEVPQADAIDLHQVPARSRSTASIRSPPSRTNSSRSSSAGSGRPRR